MKRKEKKKNEGGQRKQQDQWGGKDDGGKDPECECEMRTDHHVPDPASRLDKEQTPLLLLLLALCRIGRLLASSSSSFPSLPRSSPVWQIRLSPPLHPERLERPVDLEHHLHRRAPGADPEVPPWLVLTGRAGGRWGCCRRGVGGGAVGGGGGGGVDDLGGGGGGSGVRGQVDGRVVAIWGKSRKGRTSQRSIHPHIKTIGLERGVQINDILTFCVTW